MADLMNDILVALETAESNGFQCGIEAGRVALARELEAVLRPGAESPPHEHNCTKCVWLLDNNSGKWICRP